MNTKIDQCKLRHVNLLFENSTLLISLCSQPSNEEFAHFKTEGFQQNEKSGFVKISFARRHFRRSKRHQNLQYLFSGNVLCNWKNEEKEGQRQSSLPLLGMKLQSAFHLQRRTSFFSPAIQQNQRFLIRQTAKNNSIFVELVQRRL